MFSRRAISIIVLSSCVFQNLSCFDVVIRKNMHDRQIDKSLGKPVFSFERVVDGRVTYQRFHTTDLSRFC